MTISLKRERDGFTVIRDGRQIGRVVQMQPNSWAVFPQSEDLFPKFHFPSRGPAAKWLIEIDPVLWRKRSWRLRHNTGSIAIARRPLQP